MVYVYRAKRAHRIKLVYWTVGSASVRQAAGGWHLPPVEDRSRRDPFLDRAIVGAAQMAGLAVFLHGLRDGDAGAALLMPVPASKSVRRIERVAEFQQI